MTGAIQAKLPQTPQNGWKTAFIVLVSVLVAVLVTAVVMYRVLFPGAFTPVTLTAKEQARLESKLDRLESGASHRGGLPEGGRLQPEAYSEEGASREIRFTEKELNALLASNTELATRLAIDLSDNLASAKLLVPVDPDAPLLGGKTLKISAGIELAYRNGRPVVVLRGVSLWGVPLPNAWLGGMKNVDLVNEFGSDDGFWKSFSEGVELIDIREGQLRVMLKE